MRINLFLAPVCISCIWLFSFRSGPVSANHLNLPRSSYSTDTLPQSQAAKTDNDTSIVFEKSEVEASVDATLWKKQLEKELQPVIERAARKRMPAGTYIVVIRFLVEKDGSISDIHALNDPGYGLAAGAVRVVKSGPKWTPGTVNGKTVRSYHSQPIHFVISEG
ncbi:MAG: energy transducer TonB [Flavisolibacter sp.]